MALDLHFHGQGLYVVLRITNDLDTRLLHFSAVPFVETPDNMVWTQKSPLLLIFPLKVPSPPSA